ncbi:TetR/AcrR family transcriptional regulator [Amycolatopsis sp. DG1A-15b]|uniref:TetR/AcrR family transcriptional regulator n=1 Tax=Amycolatopsis sp. DG1A-15b TaxID=3052846 RepID=UPI00255B5E51|nr:TetR/AcrR family transcriptional regulator [Amycolatopsis sp. DG1A-15b]WIX86691.1 helix-turn-helix domain-containing protein [Amycolatopsis sp. DG1A-15b]
MARWDPGTADRLRKAALELFAEHGYDAVTITQIAERAGITRRSYFRYFPDKREVLFAGAEQLPLAVAEAVLAAEEAESPLRTALGALVEVGTRVTRLVDPSPERRAVIASSAELRERERSKGAAITAAIQDALERRGTPPELAKPAAQVAAIVFGDAFDRWIDEGGKQEFPAYLETAAATLREACG